MSSRPVIDPLAALEQPAESAAPAPISMDRFAPKPRETDQDKAAAATAVGRARGLRQDGDRRRGEGRGADAPPPQASAPPVVPASPPSAALPPEPEPQTQISARITRSAYGRLDGIRRRNRASLPELLAIAIVELEAMEKDGRLWKALQEQ